jgi:glucokinase
MMKEYTIGIDIGGTNTAFGFVTKTGEVFLDGSITTRGYKNAEHFVEILSNTLKENIKIYSNDHKLKGIGIGAPNGNYYSGCVEFAPNLEWEGIVNLVDLMKKHIDLPVFLTNDANAGAIGEMLFGGAKGMNDFIYITLGTGVGSGIVSNGKLVYGHDGFAGEIGHTFAVTDGRDCGCGRKGCLETYTSATGIVRTALEFLEKDKRQSELRMYDPAEITSKLIYDAAVKGDKTALEIFDYTAMILGRSLADAVAYTSPEAIFLFGGLAKAKEFMLHPVKQYMEKYILNIYKNKVKILPSELKEGQAAVIGAAAFIWNEI